MSKPTNPFHVRMPCLTEEVLDETGGLRHSALRALRLLRSGERSRDTSIHTRRRTPPEISASCRCIQREWTFSTSPMHVLSSRWARRESSTQSLMLFSAMIWIDLEARSQLATQVGFHCRQKMLKMSKQVWQGKKFSH